MNVYYLFRPLFQLFKKLNYIELVFTIDGSRFKDSHTLDDSVKEEFKQVCYSMCDVYYIVYEGKAKSEALV